MTKAASRGYTLKTLKAIAQAEDYTRRCVDIPRFLANGKKCENYSQRWSIEALGGDVSKTAEQYFNLPMLWIKDGQAPDYLMLAGGLLLREASQ